MTCRKAWGWEFKSSGWMWLPACNSSLRRPEKEIPRALWLASPAMWRRRRRSSGFDWQTLPQWVRWKWVTPSITARPPPDSCALLRSYPHRCTCIHQQVCKTMSTPGGGERGWKANLALLKLSQLSRPPPGRTTAAPLLSYSVSHCFWWIKTNWFVFKTERGIPLPYSEKCVRSLFTKRDLINMNTVPRGLYSTLHLMMGSRHTFRRLLGQLNHFYPKRQNRQRIQVMAKF